MIKFYQKTVPAKNYRKTNELDLFPFSCSLPFHIKSRCNPIGKDSEGYESLFPLIYPRKRKS